MRWLLVIIVSLCILACSDGVSVQGDTIFPSDIQLKTGDVVFRRGSGFTSQAVIIAEHGGAYSHVGIVVDSAGVPMIVHAVPGEPDYDGDEDRVKMDSPEAFFSKVRAQRGAVYRHADSIVAQRAAQEAFKSYRRGVLFDHDYDSSDTTKMYCTELVVYAYGKTPYPLTDVENEHLKLVGFETDCILPSALLKCKDLRKMKAF